MTLSTLLTETAKKLTDKTFLKFKKRKFTYSEIDKSVTLTSGGLRKTGLNIGDKAAIIMKNCPEYIISYFAILRAGGIAVPVNTLLIAKEAAYILKDSGCKVLIYDSHYKDLISEIKNRIPHIKTLMFDEIPVETAEPFTGSEHDIAVLLYTSGTTGFPKGAMLTHFNLISNVEACTKVMDVTHKDKVLLFLPLFHSFSFTVCVLLPVFSGAGIVLLESVQPFSKVISSIFKDKITLFVGVPTIYNILSKKKIPFILKYILKYLISIRICVSGAAALSEDTIRLFEKRFEIPLLEGYGLTEASPVVSVNPINGVRKPGSVGPPLSGVNAAVTGEDGIRKNIGETGELIVKGPNVMKGYLNKEQETADVIKDGWLYTGDMAKIDRDGYIFIVDRKKDLIIVDGMNIYPREVENAAMKLSQIEECAMAGVPDSRGYEIPVLFVKKKDNAVLSENEIRAHLKEHVSKFKMPRRLVFLENFPKTATGKIRKFELRQMNS